MRSACAFFSVFFQTSMTNIWSDSELERVPELKCQSVSFSPFSEVDNTAVKPFQLADENKYSAVGSVSFDAAVSIIQIAATSYSLCGQIVPFLLLFLRSCTLFFYSI